MKDLSVTGLSVNSMEPAGPEPARPEPGLPEGHPWLALSRWGMALRVAVACAIPSTLGVLAVTFGSLLERQRISVIETPFGPLMALVVPTALALLAAAVGPWLRRFYPFTQGLVFGVLGLAAVFALWLVAGLSGGESIILMLVFGAYFGFPVFLIACIGCQLAIWSVTRRGARVVRLLSAVLVAGFSVLWALASAGVFTTAPDSDGTPSFSCGMADDYGNYVEVPCFGSSGE